MKKFLCGIMVLLIIPFAALPACVVLAETDINYEGEIDPHTGEPVENDIQKKQSGDITADLSYSTKDDMYHYAVKGGDYAISIPSGAVTTSAVKVKAAAGVSATVYMNGEIVKPKDKKLSDPGKYVILFDANGRDKIEFTIAPELTNLVFGFSAPSGFKIITAKLDDRELDTTSYIEMVEEGTYDITYGCPAVGTRHSFRITVDHTPPELQLKNVVNGYAKGPVDISDVPSGATVKILLEDKKIDYKPVLTQSGKYKITVTDKAGNFSQYQFVIGYYLNFNSFVFFGVILLIIAGLIAYMFYSKKNLRVR